MMLKTYLAGVLTGAILWICFFLWNTYDHVEPKIGDAVRFSTTNDEGDWK